MRRLRPAEQALAAADLVVVSGGDVFASLYGVMERYVRQLDLPLAKGVPVLFLGQSIGPFENEAERALFSRTARRCRVTVREQISYDYLTRDLGLPEERVTLTADPAFLLHVDDATRTRMLEAYELKPGTYAAFALSRGIVKFRKLEAEQHLRACVEATRTLIELTGRAVLVPHVQPSHSEAENDLLLAREVKTALGDDPRCVVLDRAFHTSVEFKAVLGEAVFAVAERTHGAIGAMSSGVPALSIGYSIKAEGVLRQLLQDEDLLSRSLLPVTDFAPGHASAVVRTAWEAREAFRNELDRNLPQVKERARLNFTIARDMVSRNVA